MKNKLTDLNNHLFMALERLNDEELSDDKLEFEVKRSKSITTVAKAITDNANIMLEANKFFDERGNSQNTVPDVLRITDGTAKKGTK